MYVAEGTHAKGARVGCKRSMRHQSEIAVGVSRSATARVVVFRVSSVLQCVAVCCSVLLHVRLQDSIFLEFNLDGISPNITV